MIEISGGTIALFLSIFLSIIAVAFGYGIITNKVKNNQGEIKELRITYKSIESEFASLKTLLSTETSNIKERLRGVETALNGSRFKRKE